IEAQGLLPENATDFTRLGITFLQNGWVSVIMFALLAASLFYFARKPLEGTEDGAKSGTP
ncbi:MAG: hypothetical protein ABUS49_06135, partial [Acidobacteriota bacterium]